MCFVHSLGESDLSKHKDLPGDDVYPGDVLPPGSLAIFRSRQEQGWNPAGHGKPICLQLSPALGWSKGGVKGKEFSSAKNSGRAALGAAASPGDPSGRRRGGCTRGRVACPAVRAGEAEEYPETTGTAYRLAWRVPSPALSPADRGDVYRVPSSKETTSRGARLPRRGGPPGTSRFALPGTSLSAQPSRARLQEAPAALPVPQPSLLPSLFPSPGSEDGCPRSALPLQKAAPVVGSFAPVEEDAAG